MKSLKFPVVRNPWDGQDYVVLLHRVIKDARPSVSPSFIEVVGQNKEGQRKMFKVKGTTWSLAASRPKSFYAVDAGQSVFDLSTVVKAPGSNIEAPFQINMVMMPHPQTGKSVAVAIAENRPDGSVLIFGALEDGGGAAFVCEAKDFDRAALTPRRFVEVENVNAGVVTPLAMG